ncbi:MAG: NAD kinase [Bacteroidales bacterium]|nr:NAD kinase [Bacteroidales bacterium]
MKIALYSRTPDENGIHFITEVVDFLHQHKVDIWLFETPFHSIDRLNKGIIKGTFSNNRTLIDESVDFLFSFGGDGTFIDAANLIADSNIPIFGINTGRIGFLTSINKNNFEDAFNCLKNGNFEIESRALLHVDSNPDIALPSSFALNDVSIHPYNEDSILAIHVWANGEKVNTYWSDGLIVATPTGSTAYSLSCGGPILTPNTDVIVLTPIASHSLTVRPIVLPAKYKIQIQVQSRNHDFILSLDSHRKNVNATTKLTITQENFTIQTIRLLTSDFYSVIREKLLWGIDKRNISDNE